VVADGMVKVVTLIPPDTVTVVAGRVSIVVTVIYMVCGVAEDVVAVFRVEVVNVVGVDVVKVATQVKRLDGSLCRVPQKEQNNGILKRMAYSLT
jgi:hypothetical protein